MSVTKQLLDPIDFHSIFLSHSMEVNWDEQLFGYRHFSKYLLLCYTQERNLYIGLKQQKGEEVMAEFSFLG